jgi:hypothetical protein
MKFRKKPVVIDAFQVPPPCNDGNIGDHGTLAATLHFMAPDAKWVVANGKGEIDIETLEGTMRASNGDWIIRGVKGELYPCKPDIFAATYEQVHG